MAKTERERAANRRIGANIRAQLAARERTQVWLAETAGLSEEAVRRRMRRGPTAAFWTVNELERVARALGVTMETLTQGTNS